MPNPQPDPDAISISGHFTGQGWYRSEDRATPVISTPSLSQKLLGQPDPRTRPEFCFRFRQLHRPRLVPIGSSCDAGHLHVILVAVKHSESCRSKPWKVTESPLQFAVVSPVSGDATTWVLFSTIPSVFSDQPQPPEEPICRWSAVEGFTGLGEMNLIFLKQSSNKNKWKGFMKFYTEKTKAVAWCHCCTIGESSYDDTLTFMCLI